VDGSAGFVIRVDNCADALSILRRQSWGGSARLDDGTIITASPSGRGQDLVRFLAQAGYWPDSVAPRQQNLEEIFLSLTGGVS